MKKYLSRLLFPFTIILGPAVTYGLISMQVRPTIAVFSLLPLLIGWMMLWEKFLPYKQQWNLPDNDVKADVLHLTISQIIVPRLIKPVFLVALLSFAAGADGKLAGTGWPHHWPIVLQLILMLVIAEFGRYWVHRAAHKIHFLWKFHATHHSPNRLYWLNASRFHPLEKIFFLIPETVPFMLLGTNIETLSMYFVFNGIHGFFQHANIDVKLGPLNYIFSMSELHRFHHSKIEKESYSNFGNNLILWDIIFGTFYYPQKQVTEIGLNNPDYPKDYWGQFKAPFQSGLLNKDRRKKLIPVRRTQ